MSVKGIRIDYYIGFILGVLGVALGIYLILLQLISNGYVIDFSPSNPYSIFVGWAALGVASLFAGAIAIYKTYQIFIPLRENSFTPSRTCQHCGAIVGVDVTVCEKCKQPIADE